MPQFDFRSPRLFVEAALAAGAKVELDRNQSNYLGNVLRLAGGAEILAFNGRDGEWKASITGRKRPESLEIVAEARPPGSAARSDLRVCAAQACPAGTTWCRKRSRWAQRRCSRC